MNTTAAQIDCSTHYTSMANLDSKSLTQIVTEARAAAAGKQQSLSMQLYEQALLICEETNDFDVNITCEIIEELSDIYASEGKSNQAAFLRETARKMLARAA